MERVAASDDRLAPQTDLSIARAVLERYAPTTAAQHTAREEMLAFVDAHPDALVRSCVEGHLTASALIVSEERGAALLTLHRKLGRWLQTGGHCDGDANLAGVALREAIEESGIQELTIELEPIDLDVHAIPARPGEPQHLHLDTRFLVYAPAGAVSSISDESDALEWFGPCGLQDIDTDASLRRLFDHAFGP